ncbi:MAG TPA: FAD-dependent oxidoreductase [Myxococcota bacterium]|nr:FAD-dependent oxidoreductase [Myxococcota bacterium]
MSAASASAPLPLAGRAVAVIGGATAGAEVAGRLAEAGARVVVFEQNLRPYGKIEDGLPRWHAELRRKEYRTIDAKLSQPGVAFVPGTRVGRDVSFEELAKDWGFHAVVLANGAWRDRPLPIEGADAYVGRGLVYQNPFIIWFNHAGEADWHGARFAPADDVLVVGGGLASIDVVKVLMLETTRAKLRERGLDAPLLELEVKGIPKVLERHGLRFEDLGLRGCTLFYRRRVEDMPLVEMPEGAPPERRAKVEGARRKLLEKAVEKYRFRVEPLAAPDGLVVEGERLVGLRFRRTKMEGGRLVATDETFERRGSYVISSIGSIPDAIPGIAMKGELFAFTDWDLGRLDAWPNVFSAGNVVTGKGNIVASRKHATHVAERMVADLTERAAALAAEVAGAVAAKPPHDAAALEKLEARVRERQAAVGYPGDYAAWIARVTPPDLE